jgi:hypothetical protein
MIIYLVAQQISRPWQASNRLEAPAPTQHLQSHHNPNHPRRRTSSRTNHTRRLRRIRRNPIRRFNTTRDTHNTTHKLHQRSGPRRCRGWDRR